MGKVFSWWLAIEVIGALGLPLTALVCRNLPDRGWALAKPLSLLLVGWLIWFPLTLISALPYSQGWIAGTIIAFAGVNLRLVRRADVRDALARLWRQARGYLLLCEGVFAVAFALMAWVRSFTPGVVDTEKFMDEAFLAAIVRAPHLPPPDPWLAGYTINYYYFGHFLVGTLAKLLGTTPAVAFNVGIAAIFALVAVTVFGVAATLWAAFRGLPTRRLARAGGAGIVSALAVLIFGNFAAVQVWWQTATALATGPHASLANPLAWWLHPQLWAQQDWWATWWGPSRAIPNTITEFPAFSFLLADLHAHVLALPFVALGVGLALNLLLARGQGLAVFAGGDQHDWASGILTLAATGIALGSLYAINGWDLPTYLGLVVLTLLIQQWLAHERQLSTLLVLDLAAIVASLAVVCVLAFVPFYRGFASPAQGIAVLPPTARTPIGDLFAQFGLAIFLVLSLLTWRLAGAARRAFGNRSAALVVLGVGLLLLLTLRLPRFAGWTALWGLLVVLACAVIALGLLGVRVVDGRLVVAGPSPSAVVSDRCRARVWLFVLIGTAAALVVACEVFYLKDVFSGSPLLRMNTVFKLYYQAWLLLGIAIGPMACWLLAGARVAWCALVVPLVRALPSTVAAPRALPASATPVVAPAAGAISSGSAPLAFEAVEAFDAKAGGVVTSEAAGDAEALTETAVIAPAASGSEGDTTGFRRSPGWAVALRALGAGGIVIWMCAFGLALLGALVYPVLATASRTDGLALPRSLDGTAYMATDPVNVGDAPAIAWLNAHVSGEAVIIEAAKYDEYTHYARISTFTGLPTLIGWGGHEAQWRLAWFANPALSGIIGQRLADVQTIYTSGDAARVMGLLRQYSVSYIYVGAAERQLYGEGALGAVRGSLRVVYARDGVTIYATPWA